jgi:hypothetical protein
VAVQLVEGEGHRVALIVEGELRDVHGGGRAGRLCKVHWVALAGRMAKYGKPEPEENRLPRSRTPRDSPIAMELNPRPPSLAPAHQKVITEAFF